VVHEQLKSDGPVSLSAAIVASWARYDEALDEEGNRIDVVDPLREELIAIAKTQRENPKAFIQNKKLFGNLAQNPRFVEPYIDVLQNLHNIGAQKTLQRILN
jgi:mannitol 2-dehydrogenase